MNEVLGLLFPFFGLIVLGYGAGRLGLIAETGRAGLETFLTCVALPAFLFALVATTPASSLPGWQFVASTTFATYCAFAIAFSVGALMNGGQVPEATIQGVIGSFSGIALLAPGLVIGTFGLAAAAPTALILTFDMAMLLIVTPLMMALGGTQRTNARGMAMDIGRRIVTNPLIVATVLGLVFAWARVALPYPVTALLTTARAAAGPTALFVFGLGLALIGTEKLRLETPMLAAVKLVIHPLIVYLLLAWVGGFDPTWVKTAVLLAALPPSADALRMVEGYSVYVAGARAATLLTAAIAIATVTIMVILIVSGRMTVTPLH